MRFLPLIWAGLWRKPLRTTLTFLAVVTAFLLIGGLQGLDAMFDNAISISRLDRLYIMSRLNNNGEVALPISHAARIRAISGVASVTPIDLVAGYYRDPKEIVTGWAVDPDSFFDVFPELSIPPDQLAAWRQNRTTAVVGAALATKYGWKIGDRIPLISGPRRDGPTELAFEISGIFTEPGSTSLTNEEMRLVTHYAYENEEKIEGRGTANLFAVRVSDPASAATVAVTIDNQFANSADETESSSEKDVGLVKPRMKQPSDRAQAAFDAIPVYCGAEGLIDQEAIYQPPGQRPKENSTSFALLRLPHSHRRVFRAEKGRLKVDRCHGNAAQFRH